MFPAIFTLGIKDWIADNYGLQTSFPLTAACELYVLFYALWGSKPTQALPEPLVVAENGAV